MSREIKVGDIVRIKRGCCGQGYRFAVVAIDVNDFGKNIVYGRNYGPVWGEDVEKI